MNRYTVMPDIQSINTLTLNIDSGRVILNPEYQRKVVWSNEKKSFFIESCYLGIVPNSIILNYDTEKAKYICIDGKQRLTSLMYFINNKIPLFHNDEAVWWNHIPKNSKFEYNRILNRKEKGIFLDRKIPIVTYQDLEYHEQAHIFTRIQYGIVLTEGERKAGFIKEEKMCQVFNNFCESKRKILDKYAGDIERSEDRATITKLLCFFFSNKLCVPQKKDENKFLESIKNIKDMNRKLKIIGRKIDVIFSTKLLNNINIERKLNQNILYTTIYFINRKFMDYKIENFEAHAIRSTIRSILKYIKDNKIGCNKSKKILKTLYEEFCKRYYFYLRKNREKARYNIYYYEEIDTYE